MLRTPEGDAGDACDGVGILPEVEVEGPLRAWRQGPGPDSQGIGERQLPVAGKQGQAAFVTPRQCIGRYVDAQPDGLDRHGRDVQGLITADQVRFADGLPVYGIALAALIVLVGQAVAGDIADERGPDDLGRNDGLARTQGRRFHRRVGEGLRTPDQSHGIDGLSLPGAVGKSGFLQRRFLRGGVVPAAVSPAEEDSLSGLQGRGDCDQEPDQG